MMQNRDHFSNEVAQDWLYDFEANDFRLIDRTLAGVAAMQPDEVVDLVEAQEVLVAAECVAAAAGLPTAVLPDIVAHWLQANRPIQVKPDYVQMAQTAVARVLAGSELQAQAAQTSHYDAWQTAVVDLQTRLHQCSAGGHHESN